MFQKFIEFQIKHAKILLLLFLIILALAANTAKDLKIDPGFSVLVPSDSEYNTNDKILKKAFDANEAIIILINKDRSSIVENEIVDMNDPRILQYVEELNNALKQSSYVVQTTPPQISDDNEYLRYILYLQVPQEVGSFKEVVDELTTLSSEVGTPAGSEMRFAGLPMIIDKVPTLLISDSLRTILITVIFIILVLYWYSKNLYFTLVTVATPVSSLIFLAAMMVLLNINVTITLASIGVFILGLGADYGIHISTHYSRARQEHEDHVMALEHTIKDLRLPITASFITTLAGFAALILGVSPSSQAQGMVLAMGIAIIFATTFILFPIIMTIVASKVRFKPNFIFQKVLDGLGKLAAYQTKYAKRILWTIGLLTIIMIYGASQVQFSTSNSNWIPDDDPTSQSFRELESAFGKSDSITIVVQSTKDDLRNVQTAKDVNKLKSILDQIPSIDSITTPYDGLEYDSAQIHDSLTNNPQLSTLFTSDFTLTRIVIQSQNFGVDDSGKSLALKEIRKIVEKYPIHNAKISLYGDPVRFDELTDNLQQDAAVTTMIGLSLVFFVASSIYASLSVGFLALVPIIVAVIWAVGLMGFFGVPFTSLSTGIVSLVLGVGVDFSIHLVDSIKKYTARFNNIHRAIERSLSTSGKAIFLSSVTTFIGFMALTFAQLLGTQRLGYSLALAILAVFIISITFVPSVMSILYRREQRKLKNANPNT